MSMYVLDHEGRTAGLSFSTALLMKHLLGQRRGGGLEERWGICS